MTVPNDCRNARQESYTKTDRAAWTKKEKSLWKAQSQASARTTLGSARSTGTRSPSYRRAKFVATACDLVSAAPDPLTMRLPRNSRDASAQAPHRGTGCE